jgi:hypothetical protein
MLINLIPVYDIDNYFFKNSIGVAASGSYGAASGSVSLDLDVLDSTVSHNTQLGSSMTQFTIGTIEIPLPIHTKVIPIDQALADSLWAENERTVIRLKRGNLERALRDYATNKQAQIAPGKQACNCDNEIKT